MQLRRLIIAVLLCPSIPLSAAAQRSDVEEVASSARPEVLVVGVWHMANVREGDEDILSPRRQAEIPEVMAVLERFRPTKIALEADFHRGDDLTSLYTEYVNGVRELNRNERQQLGFRLARRLGHERVYAIDADGDFPLPRLEDYVEARGERESYEAMRNDFREWIERRDAYYDSHTLLDALMYMNSDDYSADIMAYDYELARFGEPWNWAGPDLLSDWFRRNARIYGNVVHLVDGPAERVLVIIGAGHLAWLRHNFASDPNIRLRKLAEFAEVDGS